MLTPTPTAALGAGRQSPGCCWGSRVTAATLLGQYSHPAGSLQPPCCPCSHPAVLHCCCSLCTLGSAALQDSSTVLSLPCVLVATAQLSSLTHQGSPQCQCPLYLLEESSSPSPSPAWGAAAAAAVPGQREPSVPCRDTAELPSHGAEDGDVPRSSPSS